MNLIKIAELLEKIAAVGGSFETVAEAFEKLKEDNPRFISSNRLDARSFAFESFEGKKVLTFHAGMGGSVKFLTKINYKTVMRDRLREDDQEMVYWTQYYLMDYKQGSPSDNDTIGMKKRTQALEILKKTRLYMATLYKELPTSVDKDDIGEVLEKIKDAVNILSR